MSYTNGLDKPSNYFSTKLYTGNGGTQSITGVGFQPGMNWCKTRTSAGYNHVMVDIVRGVTKVIRPNLANAEDTYTNALTSFDSDGFTLGADSNGEHNKTGDSFVSWNWKAGTSFSNDASSTGIGSIDSSGSFNNDAGFSIVSFVGTGSNATVKHGLNSAPAWIIFKDRSASKDWFVYHQSYSPATGGKLNSTANPSADSTYFQNTATTSSVFSIGTANTVNPSGNNMIAYCFAEKKGFSKMGSYVGVASSDSNFVFLGFKPSFLLIKNTSTSGTNWHMYDNKRLGYNVDNNMLRANLSNASQTDDDIDLLSNGFKLRRSTSALNNSGDTFIYYAVAESPFTTSTGIPTTAR